MSVFPYPGVPPLLNPTTAANFVRAILTGDAASVIGTLLRPRWGVFSSAGQQLVNPDNIAQFGYRRDYRVSGFPIEGGKFENYNKVATPFEVRMAMTKSGSDIERASFLGDLEALAGSLDLVTVVTPEVSYANVNCTGLAYDRSAVRGAKLLTVDVPFQQIRIATDAVPTISTQNNGAVQTTPPTQAQAAAIVGVQ